ncbi:MAG: hypothetical protein PF638_16140 [Candidatus Delongbacteria bacterium]|jgi:hypothetical protein|nr:hypothetical protein [Candidatus Delongbacteria bacterium]
MMIILLMITWFFYYGIKGVTVRETKVLAIITFVAWGLNMLVLMGMDSGSIKIFMTIYFIYSFLDYLSIQFTNKNIIDLPWMSGIRLKNNEIYLNYQIFRPITIIFINIFLLVKKQPLIGMNDVIEVDINSSDKTEIKIKL